MSFSDNKSPLIQFLTTVNVPELQVTGVITFIFLNNYKYFVITKLKYFSNN